jgi:hypothetical protein
MSTLTDFYHNVNTRNDYAKYNAERISRHRRATVRRSILNVCITQREYEGGGRDGVQTVGNGGGLPGTRTED